jgi:cobalt-zinc-cadmium efflux system membrane fusion protein
VVFEIDALGRREFESTLQYVAPLVDARTRTVRARARLANPDGALRANMFARARILVDARSSAALVPREAVQHANGVAVAFVAVSGHEYVTRRVQVASSDGPILAVTEGLVPGESVVTEGAFLLMTETLKESIGAGCCDVDHQ